LIGGVPVDFGVSARPLPDGPTSLPQVGGAQRRPPFVIEGDEYDTAFFEKTAKFLHYGAEVAIITSIEHDHIDIYPDFEQYRAAFAQFIAGIPQSGLIVANGADTQVVALVSKHARAEIAWYALQDEPHHGVAPHWLAAPTPAGAQGTRFELYVGGVYCGRFGTQLCGTYNVSNAVAAIAAASQGYGAPLGPLRAALPGFRGVARRQQVLGSPGGIAIIDDFAHHPTAVAQTLRGLRHRHRDGQLIAVFEPRSATACRNIHQEAYAQAFDAADVILLAPLGRRLIPEHERLDLEQLASDLRARGKDASLCSSVDEMVNAVADKARSGDAVAVLSNGDFGGIHEKLLNRLGRVPSMTEP
jgi:UDP-N-acetylmuramate: L-alanyl-gamma-D-glutamyl-meso-diaminopimelate ligase